MICHSPFRLRWIAATILSLAATPVLGQTYEGRVTHVLAADSIRITVVTTCIDAGCPELGDSLMVTLSEIDAPEKQQPHGEISTNALLARVHEKVVTVIQEGTDDQGRPAGHLYLEEEWLNGWAVSEGHAWVYPPTAQTKALEDLQHEAQTQQRGLWANDAPVAPWMWRKGTRDEAKSSGHAHQPDKAIHGQLAPAALDGVHTLVNHLSRALIDD